jgi:UDP-N-acetylmuramoyl-tripeptide--D-alanyl-D-alanine ligase
MKIILQKILYILSKLILLRYKPKVIGITGSVGKTSAKEAVYTILRKKFKVQRNIKNYNNEIGLPLTIIGSETGGKNIIKWLLIFMKALLMLVYWPYPKILILEMGADKPGDIRYLTRLASCYIGIITAIGKQPVHLEFFRSLEHLAREKAYIISHLMPQSWAIVNIDDDTVRTVIEKTKAQIITVGIGNEEAKLKASNINYSLETGLNFKAHYEGNTVPFKLNNMLGTPQVYAALNAIAVGLIFKMNLVDISEALKDYQSPRGRLNILKGIKDTIIIDDSYNSSPLACQQALEILSQVSASGRKIACLGNMEELGENSRRAHREIGRLLVDLRIDLLFAVGEKAKDIAEAALEKNMNQENIFTFANSDEAKKAVQNELHSGDVVLVKGSQSTRMERITKELIAEPLRAKELLIRQDKSWENR